MTLKAMPITIRPKTKVLGQQQQQPTDLGIMEHKLRQKIEIATYQQRRQPNRLHKMETQMQIGL